MASSFLRFGLGLIAFLLVSSVLASTGDVLKGSRRTLVSGEPQLVMWEKPNCQGPYSVSSPMTWISPLGQCVVDESSSRMATCDGSGLTIRTYTTMNCSGAFMTNWLRSGVCVNHYKAGKLQGSTAHLCEVDAPIAPPVTTKEAVPGRGLFESSAPCPGPGYCSPNVPFFTQYSSQDCSQGTAVLSRELSGDNLLNECYQDFFGNGFNAQYSCDHGVLTLHYYASNCTNATEIQSQRFGDAPGLCFYDSSANASYRYFCGNEPKSSYRNNLSISKEHKRVHNDHRVTSKSPKHLDLAFRRWTP